MKFNLVVNCYLVNLSFKFHENLYRNARVHILSRMRTFTTRARIWLAACLLVPIYQDTGIHLPLLISLTLLIFTTPYCLYKPNRGCFTNALKDSRKSPRPIEVLGLNFGNTLGIRY